VNRRKEEDSSSLQCFDKIVFNEDTHTYCIGEEPTSKYSVTSAISKFKPKFDTDKWANIKAKKEGITADEMKFRWQEKALYATTLGTSVHKLIESVYLNSGHYTPDYKYVQETLGNDNYLNFQKKFLNSVEGFCAFYKKTKYNITPIKNEFVVGDLNDSKVCGTLDMLAYNQTTKQYEIYDFKTNNNFTYKSAYNEYYFKPLQHLQVCEYNTYSLQLSIYRYIIEKYTNISIGACYVLWLPGDTSSYQVIETKYIKEEAAAVLANV
jgi:hypothetical protein